MAERAGHIKRPALRYYGGKWSIAPWVLQQFPEHLAYVEPFMGAASVLLQKAPGPFEVLNDIDSNVVNYFRVLRERPLDLQRALRFTPFSREEVYAACEPTEDPLERARRFHVRAWQTMHGAPHMGRNGWRFGRSGGSTTRSAVDDWNDIDRLPAVAERLKRVQIEHDDALAVIRRFDGPRTLFYVDPPYVRAARSDRWARNGYAHEMDDAGHRALADLLHQVDGMVIVSGYASALYTELYRGWTKRSTSAVCSRGTTRTEVLWLSPRAAAGSQQLEIPLGGGRS